MANPRKYTISEFSKNSFLYIKKTIENGKYPIHWHNYFEIEIVLSGKGYQYINGKKYEIKPGLLYLMLPTDLHELHFQEETTLINLSFDFPIIPPYLINYFNVTKKNVITYLDGDEFEFYKNVFEKLNLEFHEQKKYSDKMVEHLVSIILLNFTRQLNLQINSSENYDHVLKAICYLNLHFKEDPSLNIVAKAIHLDPTYFSVLFKKYTGKTYSKYLTELKIDHVKKLLIIDKMTILDISLSCGFTSISNFNRTFKQLVGMSPNKYKKLNQEKKDENN